MAQDPDPCVELTTIRGVTRTLDDWTTSFHLALTVLPGRPEAAGYVRAARRVLGGTMDEYLCFLDPEGAFVKAAGLSHLPAFAYVRLDGTLGGIAEGWDPNAWDDAVERLAKEMAWSRPLIPAPGDPPPFPGWNT